jgi:hypothetical protein
VTNSIAPYIGGALPWVRRIALLAVAIAVAVFILSGGFFHLFRNPTTPPG